MEGERMILLSCLVFMSFMISVMGHGRLMDPPSRGSMWRMGFKTPKNYNDNQLYCGGFTYQWKKMKGKCGVCGDPFMGKRPHEAGGRYATGTIAKTYQMGQVIEAKVDITANHKGYFQFKICPNNNPKKRVTQECLDQYPLMAVEEGSYMYQLPNQRNMRYKIKLQLPKGLTCTQCVFQWVYTSGNNWGVCEDGKGRTGCGPQEQFRGCADVAIVAEGSENYPTVVKPDKAYTPYVPNEPAEGGHEHKHTAEEYPVKPYRPYNGGQKPQYPVKTYQQPKRPTEVQQPEYKPATGNKNIHPVKEYPAKPYKPSIKSQYPFKTYQKPNRPTVQKPKYKPYVPQQPEYQGRPYQPSPDYNQQGLRPRNQPRPTKKPSKPFYPKKAYRPEIVGQPSYTRHEYRPNTQHQGQGYGPNAEPQGQGYGPNTKTQSEGYGPNAVEEKSCMAIGVWKTVPGMNKWCVQNCAGGYCPPSHCKC